jgi:hypothetical protein
VRYQVSQYNIAPNFSVESDAANSAAPLTLNVGLTGNTDSRTNSRRLLHRNPERHSTANGGEAMLSFIRYAIVATIAALGSTAAFYGWMLNGGRSSQ